MNRSSQSLKNEIKNLKNLGQLELLIRSFERFIDNEVAHISFSEDNNKKIFESTLYAALQNMKDANEMLEDEIFLQK